MENPTISILCYTLNENLLDKIGLVNDGNYLSTIESELNDSSLLHCAKNIFKEKYNIDAETKYWKYLGEIKRKKDLPTVYCYALDVTDMKIIDISMYPLNVLLKITDTITQTIFLRLFLNLYKKDIL